jgi:hypothetical protein
MMNNPTFVALVTAAPTNFNGTKIDWDGYREAMALERIEPSAVVAATWCTFGTRNIEPQIDPSGLGIVYPERALVSAGKRKMLGKSVKYWMIPFRQCRAFGAAETADDRGFGKYCIEFAAAGGIILGP